MSLQKGDFILINYTAKVKETDEVFDTTIEEVAKKEHLYKEGAMYEPKLIVVGEGWMLKAVDESFMTMKLKKAESVELPPDKAFGPRDPEKIKRVPLKQLLAKDVKNPTIGMRVDYNGKMATIRSIGAGRVLLDFNPPLAGRTLVYDITVDKKLDVDKDKVAALIHRRIPIVEAEKFKFTIQKETLAIEMPEESFYIEGVQIAKRGIAMDIQRYLPVLTEIKFIEAFRSERKPEVEKEAEIKKETKTKAKPIAKSKPKAVAKPDTKTKARVKPKAKSATKNREA
jgi:peptidylprolyl isomerase